jgi:hypothetical protein
MTLAGYIRQERTRRHLTPSRLARQSRGRVSAVEIQNIERAGWASPPSEILHGVARGLEPRHLKRAAEIWARMMKLAGNLSAEQIDAIRRMAA